MTKRDIKQLVTETLSEINEEFNLNLDRNSVLVGEIDSIILVNLIVLLEAKFETEMEPITIADDKAFSQENSPFKTVETLIDYLFILTNE
jgi:acyl carrier protein